jgi:hypothetical protein
MSMYINGVLCSTIEELEIQIAPMNDYQKQCIRNDFNGVPNDIVALIPPVTNQQLRSALVLMSFQQNKPELHPDSIKAFIETLAEPNRSLAIQQWEYSNEMLRNNVLVNSMAASLGLSSSDLDNLWLFAKTLP